MCIRSIKPTFVLFRLKKIRVINTYRSRSRSPAFRSRSKSPGEWKRPERRGNGRSSRSEKIVRLYVSNLPYEVKWPELKDLFKDKGFLFMNY